jgi:hypothetical protein
MDPPPTIDRIASRSRSSLCGKSLMVMRAMGTSAQASACSLLSGVACDAPLLRTIGDVHPEAEASDEAMDRGRKERRPRGALRRVQVSLADQQIAGAVLPDIHQSRAVLTHRKTRAKTISTFLSITYRNSAGSQPRLARRWHYRSASRCSNVNTTQHSVTFGELQC